MKFTNIIRTLCLGAALSSTALFANTVKMTDTPYDGGLSGGEFKAAITNGPTFYTFCLEYHIGISLPYTYNYTIDTRAFAGGVDNHDLPGNPAGDPLSKGTAYLYEQFFKGTLVGSTGSGNYNDNRSYNAGLLQQAIWTLEDEKSFAGTNYYLNLVKGIFGNTGAFETVGADSKVKVMNLWGIKDRKDIQSMLIYVPDSGMTAVLLGLGLLSLAAVRRKL